MSEWFPSNTLLISWLFACHVEGPRSNVLRTNIRKECELLWPTSQEDALSTKCHYKTFWADFFQFPPHWLKLFQSILKCFAKKNFSTREAEIHKITGTFLSDNGHLQAVKNTSCQISALNKVRKGSQSWIISIEANTPSFGQLTASLVTEFPVICNYYYCLIVNPWQKYWSGSHWNIWDLFFIFKFLGTA